jgi:hypothetical protein
MTGEPDLESTAQNVCDKEIFIAFWAALSEDWEDEQSKEADQPSQPYGPGAHGWENRSIGSFLEAAGAFGQDHLNKPNSELTRGNRWRQAAAIIYTGKFYE